MKQSSSTFEVFSQSFSRRGEAPGWDLMECDKRTRGFRRHKTEGMGSSAHEFAPDWANAVPNLIEKLVAEISEKKKLELRFNLLEVLTNDIRVRLEKLECARTIIVPINTFAPEPYELLKPILISVQYAEEEFEAGWFDANIHTSGENEEEAVSNLKSLILDCFDSLTKEPVENLGIETKRQLDVIKTFIKRNL